MAERGVAVLAAAARAVGAATVVNVAVVGCIQLLLLLQPAYISQAYILDRRAALTVEI